MSNFPVYSLRHSATVSTAITVLQLKAGTNGPMEIIRAAITNTGLTTAAQYRAALVRKSAAATVTTAVAGTHLFKQNPVWPTTDASLGTSATGVIATAEGTDTDVFADRGFYVTAGYEWLPTDDERIVVPQGGIIGLKFLAAPASATWIFELVWKELRGG